MATRFYFDAVAAPTVSVTFQSTWEQTTNAVRRLMTPVRMANGQADATVASAETSASGTFDVLLAQFYSTPLAAQTIGAAATVRGQARFTESDLAANMVGSCYAAVFSPDGATNRGALYDHTAQATEFATSLTNRNTPASATVAGAVTAQEGDVIVVEIGYRATNTDIASFTGTLSYGRGAAADLAVDEADTDADNAWFEVSQNLLFMPDPAGGISNKFGKFTDLIEQGTGSANAALTVTLPAVRGHRHAITSIEAKRAASAAVAGTAALYVSTLNLGDLGWVVGNAMAGGGTTKDIDMKMLSNPLVSDAASTPTVFAFPAPGANCLWSVRVGYRLVP